MFSYFNKDTYQGNLCWSRAIALAVEEATRAYGTSPEAKLYMYNPVGCDPTPLEDLVSTLESVGAARIQAGHQIHLIITTKGKQTWTGVIDRDFTK